MLPSFYLSFPSSLDLLSLLYSYLCLLYPFYPLLVCLALFCMFHSPFLYTFYTSSLSFSFRYIFHSPPFSLYTSSLFPIYMFFLALFVIYFLSFSFFFHDMLPPSLFSLYTCSLSFRYMVLPVSFR